jgi:pimeloyl-ACP methyl ester carboxylesterase
VIVKNYEIKSDLTLNLSHLTPDSNNKAPILLFIHPTGFTGNMFSSVGAHLRNMNIFTLDLRSHGASQRGDVSNWHFLAKDLTSVFDFLKNLTGQNKFYGIGISSGSSALALHASMHSDDFHGLYLCEPIVFPPNADLSMRDILSNSAKNRRANFDSREMVYERFSSRGALSNLNKSSIALYAKYGFKTDNEEVTLRCNKEDEEAIYISGTSNSLWDSLKSIKIRSNIVYGELSNTMDPKKAEEIAGQIPNSTTECLKGVGHFTLFENPTFGAESISSFIAQDK